MFFQSIYQMITAGTDLNINIRKVDNSLSVAVIPRRNSLKEDTRQNMVPLVVNGTPAELDMGFLQTILQPIQHIHITDYQRPFILIGTTSLLTSSQKMGTNASRCLSPFCTYALYRLSPVHLQNVRHQFQGTDR